MLYNGGITIMAKTQCKIDKSHYRALRDITIDMTSWIKEQSDSQPPYSVMFHDDTGAEVRVPTLKVKSDAMGELLNQVQSDYHAVPLDNTLVTIICPKELVGNGTSPYSFKTQVKIQDLREKGMKSLDFSLSKDSTMLARLESVLDSVTHKSCEISTGVQRMRQAAFLHSIYRYDRVDNKYAFDVNVKNEAEKWSFVPY